MKSKLSYVLGVSFFVSLVIGFRVYWYHAEFKRKQVVQRKIDYAFQELNFVFPAHFFPKENFSESDLKQIVDDLDKAQSQENPTQLQRNGNDLQFVPFVPMPYRLNRADAPWEVVLSYEKPTQQVRVEIFTEEATGPVSMREYPCCH
jgi:hypothetical protein